jgi:hypothetical protein
LGGGAKEQRLSSPNCLQASPKKVQTKGVGKGKTFPRQRFADQKAIAERKEAFEQGLKGRPVDPPFRIKRSD